MREILKQIQRLEITTKHLVDGLMAGSYHSIFRGQGVEFCEIREYVPGDDIRSIDWKVTARLNSPYVKEFIEERDLRVYFAVDLSGSAEFGNTLSKRRKAAELAASLMFSAMKNNDNVGLFIFTDTVERYIPARKGRRHVLKVLSALLTHEPASRMTDIAEALSFISRVAKKRGIVFLVSDFMSSDFSKELSIIRKRHDLIAVHIVDAREHEIPDIGLIELEDEETGEQLLLDTSNHDFRQAYKKRMQDERNAKSQLFRKLKIDTITISTEQDYSVPVRQFFAMRKRRRA